MKNETKKVIVFDVDGTLLHRTMQKIQNLSHDYSSNGRYIYARPNLNYLALHLPILAEKAQFVLWTSMMHKNAEKIQRFLGSVGLKFDKLYTQEHCRQDFSKDLNVIAQDLETNVQDVYLIDDSPHKRIGDQNFIKIEEYNGEKRDDADIIRIIQQIYKIVDLPYVARSMEDLQDFQLINKLKKLKVNEPNQIQGEGDKNKNKKKQKKQKNQKQKQNINKQYREKLPNKKKQQKVEQTNEQTMIEHNGQFSQDAKKQPRDKPKHKPKQNNQIKLQPTPPPVKLNPDTKVIVFDLNKTLIIKQKQQQIQLAHLKNQQKIQGSIIYNRPHIDIFKTIIQSHPQLQIKYMVWTTMTGKSVTNHCKQVVANLPAQFTAVINGVQNEDHPGKDLLEVCTTYGCTIDNVMLVDDSPYKQVNHQNFYNVYPYQGDVEDIQMIRVAGVIDQFIGCVDDNCPVKNVIEQYQDKLIAADLKYKQQFIKYQEKLKNHQQNHEPLNNIQQKINIHLLKTPNIECIVFDINETLLTRHHKLIEDVQCDDKNQHYFFYSRPHLLELNQFLKDRNIRCCLWSTIKAQNCEILKKLLRKKGFQFEMLFSGEDLEHGKKNLETVAKQLNIPVDNIVLIDDNPKKRIENQNYIQVSPFNPENQQDDTLLHLVAQLTKILMQIKQ